MNKIDVENIPKGSKVELYISPSCPYCRKAMEHYDSVGTPYVKQDAANDRRARERMFSYTGGDPTVPAIVVDGNYVQSGWAHRPEVERSEFSAGRRNPNYILKIP